MHPNFPSLQQNEAMRSNQANFDSEDKNTKSEKDAVLLLASLQLTFTVTLVLDSFCHVNVPYCTSYFNTSFINSYVTISCLYSSGLFVLEEQPGPETSQLYLFSLFSI